jgi:hypothetical protein
MGAPTSLNPDLQNLNWWIDQRRNLVTRADHKTSRNLRNLGGFAPGMSKQFQSKTQCSLFYYRLESMVEFTRPASSRACRSLPEAYDGLPRPTQCCFLFDRIGCLGQIQPFTSAQSGPSHVELHAILVPSEPECHFGHDRHESSSKPQFLFV